MAGLAPNPVWGWHFHVELEKYPADGRAEATVTMRFVGPGEAYEVSARVWTDEPQRCTKRVSVDRLAKMTAESTPLTAVVDYPLEKTSLWVGVSWTEPTKAGVVEQAARQNVVDLCGYQRWKWNWRRNILRGKRIAPHGGWQDIPDVEVRDRFKVEESHENQIPLLQERATPAEATPGQETGADQADR